MNHLDLTQHANLAPKSILALLNTLDDVYFFMKDREGRFIGGNNLQLEKLGLDSEEELIGKTDLDFFPSYMIARFAKDDAQVIETEEPILRRVELVTAPDGTVSWHITSKFPLYDNTDKCIGIIGYMRDFERSDNTWQPYRRMNAVISYINQHFSEPIQMAQLAKVARLSISQFERRFRSMFEQTPARFLILYRLTRANQSLIHTDKTISQVAQEAGFYDHSHFTREFQKVNNMPPSRYRKLHQEGTNTKVCSP